MRLHTSVFCSDRGDPGTPSPRPRRQRSAVRAVRSLAVATGARAISFVAGGCSEDGSSSAGGASTAGGRLSHGKPISGGDEFPPPQSSNG